MRVLLSGGITGGHINPALAIGNIIKENDPHCELAFAGNKSKLEYTLALKAGYKESNFYNIRTEGRGSLLDIIQNIKAVYFYFASQIRARKIIKEFKPDLVIGTGGHGCFAIMKMASKMNIPTAVHESNAIPGKAIKMLSKYVDRIYVNFEDVASLFSKETINKTLFTGNPVIKDKNDKHETIIPNEAETVILSFGGSGGAYKINDTILEYMNKYVKGNSKIFHIHATGNKKYDETILKAKELGLLSENNISINKYIYDMPYVQSRANVVISRAGAMTISEMALGKKACILIPLPTSANQHQLKNAQMLDKNKAGILLEEKDLNLESLSNNINRIIKDENFKKDLETNISKFAKKDSNEIIYNDLMKLIEKDK